MEKLVIFAPNWLGDAVMALPAIADVRRHAPGATIAVAARPPVAPLFTIVAGVDEVVAVEPLEKRFDTALLLPNSFRSAWRAARAEIPERWGYRTQLRGALLTRAVARPRRVHQADYYRHLVQALGFPNGNPIPHLDVPPDIREAGAQALRRAGWDGRAPVVALAPGAAYGGAKRWPPEYFAEVAADLATDGVHVVMIGTAADAETAALMKRAFEGRSGRGVQLASLVGLTDLPTLAGVLANSGGLVTNDSGAMHLAAAIGVPVTAMFGPTNERFTRPLGDTHTILTHDVWCRPCMLRECPINHGCMRGIMPAAVIASTRTRL